MSVTLDWSNDQKEHDISDALIAALEELLRLASAAEGVESGEVGLSLVDDETIRELNREYRGLDKPTDVLSFAMREKGRDEPDIVYEDGEDEDGFAEEDDAGEPEELPELLGDIVISVPRAALQAREYGHSFERELGFLFVHGFLHLMGYDHEDEEAEKRMFGIQERILQQAGLHR